MAETDYLATALAAASKGRTQKGQTPEQQNEDEHDESGPEAEEVGEGHHVAAREMMDCAKSEDHEGYARALHSFIKMSQ